MNRQYVFRMVWHGEEVAKYSFPEGTRIRATTPDSVMGIDEFELDFEPSQGQLPAPVETEARTVVIPTVSMEKDKDAAGSVRHPQEFVGKPRK